LILNSFLEVSIETKQGQALEVSDQAAQVEVSNPAIESMNEHYNTEEETKMTMWKMWKLQQGKRQAMDDMECNNNCLTLVLLSIHSTSTEKPKSTSDLGVCIGAASLVEECRIGQQSQYIYFVQGRCWMDCSIRVCLQPTNKSCK
jgi:hypothetical protein